MAASLQSSLGSLTDHTKETTFLTMFNQLASKSSYPKMRFKRFGKHFSKNPRKLSLPQQRKV
jgi:hypothetical protein